MNRPPSGYTLIEVMIVFSISTMLLLSALILFNGKQGTTEFTQSVYDLQSKLRNIANQISNGSSDNQSGYSCTVKSSYPDLSASASAGIGTSNQCINLGKALVFAKDDNKMYIATIAATHNIWTGGVDTGSPITDISNAHPTPALDDTTANGTNPGYVLDDTYHMQPNLTIKSSKITDSSGTTNDDWYLVGIYVSPAGQSSGFGQGIASLELDGYSYNQPASAATTRSLKDCIEGNGGVCASREVRVKVWDLCVQSDDGNQTALIKVTNSANGLATQLLLENSGC